MARFHGGLSLKAITVYLWARVPLANGRGTAIVWAMDYSLVSQYRWQLNPGKQTDYAQRGYQTPDGNWHIQKMHQLITGEKYVDHANRNGLDNRRSNLRTGATPSQHNANRGMFKNNTLGFKGVYWYKRDHKWRGQVQTGRKTVWEGLFDDPVEAAYGQGRAGGVRQVRRPELP